MSSLNLLNLKKNFFKVCIWRKKQQQKNTVGEINTIFIQEYFTISRGLLLYVRVSIFLRPRNPTFLRLFYPWNSIYLFIVNSKFKEFFLKTIHLIIKLKKCYHNMLQGFQNRFKNWNWIFGSWVTRFTHLLKWVNQLESLQHCMIAFSCD